MSGKQDLLRQLPAVDRVLREAPLQALAKHLPQATLTDAVQAIISELRSELLQSDSSLDPELLGPLKVAEAAAESCHHLLATSLRKVVNATGTLLHTNLGRAPLAGPALRAIEETAAGYSNLELDLSTGQRGERFSHVEALLTKLTGAEAALVVNNNAGAVLLALSALARGREAVVSRGELVEIGGAFRIPEVMEAGGVVLREVGASNRTHLKDYELAITDETALLLKVHTSNYRIVGFSKEVPASDLVPLAHEHGLPVMEDLGSGMLHDLSAYGLPQEPTVADTLSSGVDLVTFSGDKLLGGPQAGIIVGRRELVQALRRHPLARALRIDKLTLAALEATLRLYLQPEQLFNELPVMRMFAAEPAAQKERCLYLLGRLQEANLPVALTLVEDVARVGGGAMPLVELPDWAVEIRPQASVDVCARRLRQLTPAVICRVQNDALRVNLRAVMSEDEYLLGQLLMTALRDGTEH